MSDFFGLIGGELCMRLDLHFTPVPPPSLHGSRLSSQDIHIWLLSLPLTSWLLVVVVLCQISTTMVWWRVIPPYDHWTPSPSLPPLVCASLWPKVWHATFVHLESWSLPPPQDCNLSSQTQVDSFIIIQPYYLNTFLIGILPTYIQRINICSVPAIYQEFC
jgi:hypothetical protein